MKMFFLNITQWNVISNKIFIFNFLLAWPHFHLLGLIIFLLFRFSSSVIADTNTALIVFGHMERKVYSSLNDSTQHLRVISKWSTIISDMVRTLAKAEMANAILKFVKIAADMKKQHMNKKLKSRKKRQIFHL